MSATTAVGEQRSLLSGIRWATLQAILEDLDLEGHPRGRMSYDQGTLEFVTTSRKHEQIKTLIARMIEALALELDLVLEGLGSTTLLREDLDKGVEPDECFYVAGAEAIAGKDTLDLPDDPPPDLAIEVEVTRRAVDRMSRHLRVSATARRAVDCVRKFEIYAPMGVPEVWRCGDAGVRIYRLAGGRYVQRKRSKVLPYLTASDLSRFLALRGKMNQTAIVRAFRDWARKRFNA